MSMKTTLELRKWTKNSKDNLYIQTAINSIKSLIVK
jgi:hypothetical protein